MGLRVCVYRCPMRNRFNEQQEEQPDFRSVHTLWRQEQVPRAGWGGHERWGAPCASQLLLRPDPHSSFFFLLFFWFIFLKIVFNYSHRETQRERESERQRPRQREKQAPCREPGVGLDPATRGHALGRRQMLTR